jgi:hypothetical protein
MPNGIRFAEQVLPDDQLNQLLRDEIADFRRDALNDTSVSLRLLVKYSADGLRQTGQAYIVPEFPNDLPTNVKERALYEVGLRFCKEADAIPYVVVLMSDGWYITRQPGPDERISQAPDRRECLTIVVTTIDGRMAWSMIPYSRKDNGSRIFVEDDVDTKFYQDIRQRGHLIDKDTSRRLESHLISAFYSGVLDFVEGLGDKGPDDARWIDNETSWLDDEGD